MATHNKPRFKHDCKACIFLGTYAGHDLYYCKGSESSSMGGSLIARYGNDGSNYASSSPSITHKLSSPIMQQDGLDSIRAIRVALLIAYDMGIVGDYKDNQSKGYRIIRQRKLHMSVGLEPAHVDVSDIITNERKAYSQAYAIEKDADFITEIVSIISTDEDDLF